MTQPEPNTAEPAKREEQATLLQTVEAERDLLLAQNLLLRGVNEKLVLATFAAQELRDEAKAANQRQNEFLAMLAHELRNPLAPISMASTMLSRMASPSSELLGVQKIIERQVAHLSRLLDDLLDAARGRTACISVRGWTNYKASSPGKQSQIDDVSASRLTTFGSSRRGTSRRLVRPHPLYRHRLHPR